MIITLLDGTTADTADIIFSTSDYSFILSDTSGTRDVTKLVSVADKRANWSNFDITVWNNLVYDQIYAASHAGANPPAVGSTSTADIFFNQLATEPLVAPLQALDTGISEFTSSSGVQTIAIFAGLALAAYLIVKSS